MAQPKKTLLNIPKTKVAASTEIPSTRSKLHAPGADRPQRTGVQLYLACCAVRIQVLTRPRTSVRATVAPPEHAEVFIFKPFRALLSRGVLFLFFFCFLFSRRRGSCTPHPKTIMWPCVLQKWKNVNICFPTSLRQLCNRVYMSATDCWARTPVFSLP